MLKHSLRACFFSADVEYTKTLGLTKTADGQLQMHKGIAAQQVSFVLFLVILFSEKYFFCLQSFHNISVTEELPLLSSTANQNVPKVSENGWNMPNGEKFVLTGFSDVIKSVFRVYVGFLWATYDDE